MGQSHIGHLDLTRSRAYLNLSYSELESLLSVSNDPSASAIASETDLSSELLYEVGMGGTPVLVNHNVRR